MVLVVVFVLEKIVDNIFFNGWKSATILFQVRDQIVERLTIVHPAPVGTCIEKFEHLLINLFVGRELNCGLHIVVGCAYMVIIA